MYDIKRISDTKWSISVDKRSPFVGSLKEVSEVAVAMGFDMEDLEEGVNEIAWMDHDAAHFGINRTFIFTYDTKKVAA